MTSPFGPRNLPYGVGGVAGAQPRVMVALGESALDLHAAAQQGLLDGTGVAPDVFAASSLNPFMALGRPAWQAVRAAVSDLVADPDQLPAGVLVHQDDLTMLLPVAVGDYVDGYAGIHHASNLGRMLRPDSEPLLPNWKRLPVAYHGRAGTVVVSGTDIVRPSGQVLVDGEPVLRPTATLDIELEVGFLIGAGNELGQPIPIDEAGEHIFGLVLLNDWSARDIQAFEYQPLGPFLAKSFATSISPWVVTLDALEPFLVPGLAGRQDPVPASYLRTGRSWLPDLHLEVVLETEQMRRDGTEPAVVSRADFADVMYWSMAQQLAHATVNGASTRPGDLFGSGTVSGPDAAIQSGSFMELSWRGSRPVELPTGEQRTFLEDGDRVTLRGWCGQDDDGFGLGEVTGLVRPAIERKE